MIAASVIYFALMRGYAVVDRPFASGLASVSDVLLFNPGFGLRAAFDRRAGLRGEELHVDVEHRASGMLATNRLDLRFRVWLPMALFVALTAVTPASVRARLSAMAIGLGALGALAVVSAWLIAVYPAISAPENVLGLGAPARVGFNVAYSALVLSNPTSGLIPVLIWGVSLRRSLREAIEGFVRAG